MHSNCPICGNPIPLRNRQFCSRNCSNSSRQRALELRFWEKVSRAGEDDCWMWTAASLPDGAGIIAAGAKLLQDNGVFPLKYYAHHVAWKLSGNSIPEGRWLLHKCGKIGCCNPKHMFLGSPADVANGLARGCSIKRNNNEVDRG